MVSVQFLYFSIPQKIAWKVDRAQAAIPGPGRLLGCMAQRKRWHEGERKHFSLPLPLAAAAAAAAATATATATYSSGWAWTYSLPTLAQRLLNLWKKKKFNLCAWAKIQSFPTPPHPPKFIESLHICMKPLKFRPDQRKRQWGQQVRESFYSPPPPFLTSLSLFRYALEPRGLPGFFPLFFSFTLLLFSSSI